MLSGLKGKSSIDWSKCNMAYVNHRCVKLDDETSTHYKALPLFLSTWENQGLNVIKLSGSTDAIKEAELYTSALCEFKARSYFNLLSLLCSYKRRYRFLSSYNHNYHFLR